MIQIDMWYGNKPTEADKIDITFNDLDARCRGNIYKQGRIIGDYTCTNSTLLEKVFPQLVINWD